MQTIRGLLKAVEGVGRPCGLRREIGESRLMAGVVEVGQQPLHGPVRLVDQDGERVEFPGRFRGRRPST